MKQSSGGSEFEVQGNKTILQIICNPKAARKGNDCPICARNQDPGPGLVKFSDWCTPRTEMFVLYQSPWLLVASRPGKSPETGWSLALIHQLTPSSPTTWGFWIECPRNCCHLAWSFQFHKSDLSPGFTLMLIPSLVYKADDDVRDKCLKTELGSFSGYGRTEGKALLKKSEGLCVLWGKKTK